MLPTSGILDQIGHGQIWSQQIGHVWFGQTTPTNFSQNQTYNSNKGHTLISIKDANRVLGLGLESDSSPEHVRLASS